MPISEDKIKQITNRSEYFQDILEKVPSRITTWGNTGMLIILILLCIGLKSIKYPDEIESNISVINENPPIGIYSRTSGRISSFLKSDQEHVSAGDWIIILNNSANYKDVLTLSNIIRKVDIKNFGTSLDQLQFPQELTLGDIQSVYFDFLTSVAELNRYAREKQQDKIYNIDQSRQLEVRSKTQALKNQLALNEKEMEIARQDYERMKHLYDLKVATKPELEQKEVIYLSEKEKLEENKTNLVNAKIEDAVLHKEFASTGIEKGDQDLKYKNDVFQKFNSLVFAISEWKSKYVLISPINGKLNLYDIRNESQFLLQDKRAFTITPVNPKNYYGIIKLPIENSGKVQLGQQCIIKLQNFPYTEYGMLRGKIESISPTTDQGFFNVMVLLPNQLMTTQHKKLNFGGELNGSAEIIIKDLNLFDRLFYSLIGKY